MAKGWIKTSLDKAAGGRRYKSGGKREFGKRAKRARRTGEERMILGFGTIKNGKGRLKKNTNYILGRCHLLTTYYAIGACR